MTRLAAVLLAGLVFALTAGAVFLAISARQDADEAVTRVQRVERIVACEKILSPECRRLGLRVMRACLNFAPCRKALLKRDREAVREQIERAVERLGGDALGPDLPGGLHGPG